jgi:hypothetical protein
MLTRNAHPENAPGDFYVEDQCCTMCAIPFTEAPALFGTTTDESHCFVKKQPSTEVELGQMVNAIQCAELNCIRYGGSSRTIQVRLVQISAGSICDALPQDLQDVSASLERQALHRWQTKVENERIDQSWWRQLLRFLRQGV